MALLPLRRDNATQLQRRQYGTQSALMSPGPRASRPLMIMSGRDARGPEEQEDFTVTR